MAVSVPKRRRKIKELNKKEAVGDLLDAFKEVREQNVEGAGQSVGVEQWRQYNQNGMCNGSRRTQGHQRWKTSLL